jgi:NAD(P)H-dependent FMN reductase
MRVLLISGSTRDGSSNTFALRALHDLDSGGVTTELYQGLRGLPAFVPDGPVPAEVVDLLSRIQAADAIVFSTPEYAGGLPGALKNLLDWTVGGGQLYGKPVGWLDVANPGRGQGARAQLRTVLDYVGARIVENACVHVTLDRTDGAMRLPPGEELTLSSSTAALRAAVEEVVEPDGGSG